MKRHKVSIRRSAAAAGAVTYSGGKACQHGHPPVRYVLNGGCVQCCLIAAAAQRERQKLARPAQ